MKMLTIEMPDGSKWGVPMEVIARNRAAHYAHEFDGDVERSMAEDTMPLFESDDYEVKDWAANNMNWSDVAAQAKKLQDAPAPDFQEAWVNGDKAVIEVAAYGTYAPPPHHVARPPAATQAAQAAPQAQAMPVQEQDIPF